jgi:glutamate--cysteine ligase
MRPYLRARGRLAERMMTQTASIQCAFDYADPADWARKFRAAALVTPVATALFANSAEVDGAPSGWRSFRQAIWRETDPARCGLPDVVFDAGFGLAAWIDWALAVPTIFRHRGRGLVPACGVPFATLMAHEGHEAIRMQDWETHVSTLFTEVRSYGYLEVRCADLQPRQHVFAVPSFWTGLLYDDTALEAALRLGSEFDSPGAWREGQDRAARAGLDDRRFREQAAEALGLARQGLSRSAARFAGAPTAIEALDRLAADRGC